MLATTLLLTSTLVVGGAVAHSEAEGESVGPPVNLGFEDGILKGDPEGWDVGPSTDGVMVVDTEDGSDSPTYATTGTTIEPNQGDLMLRLGTPKEIAETQTPGPTTVSQTFAAPSRDLLVAARVLSWEFRRNDNMTISTDGATLARPVVFFGSDDDPDCEASAADAIDWSCTVVPATRKGVLADTGWQVLRLTPTPGETTITLTYTVEGTSNSSHATWGYFDDLDEFSDAVFEGQVVRLRDIVGEDGLPLGITSWDWTVTGPGTSLSSAAPDPTFIPPDQGSYDVTLVATHPDGSTTIATSFEVTNTPALANALDVEVLAGERVPFRARYLDAGWLDAVAVGVTTDPASNVTPDVVFDPSPALQRGAVTASLEPGTNSAMITVDDGDGELAPGSTAAAAVTVIDPAARKTERVGDVVGAPLVPADLSRLQWLPAEGDVDVLEVGLRGITPDGATGPVQELLPGTEVVVALDEVPADFDLVVLARTAGSTETAPYQMAPYQMAPYQMAPYQMAPYQMAPYQMAPYQMAPYQMAPYQMAALGLSPYQMAAITTSPYQMAPYQMAPLSSDPYATANGTGGGDIDPAELGIEALLADDPSLRVAGFSANRGLAPESVLVRVEQPGTELFAVVVGADGAHDDTAPYRMRLESSVPFSSLATAAPAIASALEAEVCAPRTVALEGSTIAPRYPDGYTLPADPATVIVTQLDRLRPLATADEWDAFLASLGSYAASVDGTIVSVDPTAYADWDAHPCSVAEANGVTDTIRAAVQAAAGDATEYLVVVGSDDVVPFRRVASGVVIGDEAQYLGGSFLRPGSPLAAALATSHELTDDFYSDPAPRTFQTGELYLPELATGRLVETPAEITGQLEAYASSAGSLDASTAMVAAHDFLLDGGQQIATTLDSRTTVDVSLLRENWSADDLRCGWLGIGPDCSQPDIASPNSHWTHYASLSASGFSTPDLTDIVTSEEVAATAPDAARQLVFTIGCHAGFNVPDGQSLSGDGYGIDPALDFAQAMARRQAVYVASTGFGLGETEGLAGTERLMADFAAELLVDGVSAGEALLAAKHAYLGALSTVSTYDVKSLVQQTLYGIPHYRVGLPAGPSAVTTASTSTPLAATSSESFVFAPTFRDGGRTYWTVDGTDGDVQVTPGRPWQPRAVFPVDPTTRGVLVTGGTVHDVPDVTPVVTRPTMEWELAPDPSDLDGACRDSWWPADLATVNDGQVVVVPGQFRCDGTDDTGTQRLYDTLDLELLTSTSDDRTPPTAGPLQLTATDTGVTASFPASDASGIVSIVPLVIDPVAGTVHSESLDVTGTGPYTIELPGVTPEHELVIQVVDGASNVTTLTGRGANLRLLDVEASATMLTAPDPTVEFTFTLPSWTTSDGPVSYRWDFGDGTGTESGIVDTGTHTTSYTYADPWTPRTAILQVRDANGGTATVAVEVRTCDPVGDVPTEAESWADLVGCGVEASADDQQLTFSVHLAAPVDAQGSYRLEITYESGKKATTTKLKYDHANASASGAKSLVVDVVDGGHTIRYRVDIADLGMRKLSPLTWMAEVQAGISGEPTAGFVDRMPDEGQLSWGP